MAEILEPTEPSPAPVEPEHGPQNYIVHIIQTPTGCEIEPGIIRPHGNEHVIFISPPGIDVVLCFESEKVLDGYRFYIPTDKAIRLRVLRHVPIVRFQYTAICGNPDATCENAIPVEYTNPNRMVEVISRDEAESAPDQAEIPIADRPARATAIGEPKRPPY